MPSHENLLRLRRWQLEERRRYATELEVLSERLRADLGLLEAAIALEAATSDWPPRSEAAKHPTALMLMERQRKLEHSLAEVERQMVTARAAVTAVEEEIDGCELASAHRNRTGSFALPRLRRSGKRMSNPSVVREHAS